ncbi:2-amino-4-hydroxy-6-hydroxymethyldihydropteridine diphosphokinase [Campylobacter sp. VBCF_02 NA5]|uniref:2-amino-4-hydroxy-6- hydroxymethyldihydropteridine diphosphokinase n=1 Tax=Campylobacter sp. VBCF_02 NA5 TaxID=2983834 RepID=UPI0022E9C3A9|nr:2-amino-4-hydroxy-6-hydroxymethyldihydropteridine diphosphokinase [Campylobacter sp. VBCF_02 NA5]MDA3061391.1 2-amino-4-hydroxy-6-hydroxymethyldihydropteridine diphosphokinase [Campylobacter sp. VBCF_02 NA5]
MQILAQKNGFLRLNEAVRVIKSRNFPRKFAKKENFKFCYILGLGGNIGDSRARFERVYHLLQKNPNFFVCASSQILENKPFGFLEQSNFLNATLCVQSSLAPNLMLKTMQKIELKFGRKRSFKNAPRTLDIDILYSSAKIRRNERLIVPHPGAAERISVIYPLGSMIEKGLV